MSKSTTVLDKPLGGDFQQIMLMTAKSGKDATNYRDILGPICELIDNSIDAKAKRIDIDIEKSTISFRDDGNGFDSESAMTKCFTDICNPQKDGTKTIGKYNFGQKRLFLITGAEKCVIVTYPPNSNEFLTGEIYYDDSHKIRVKILSTPYRTDDMGTTITYSYSEALFKQVYSEKNMREIRGELAMLYSPCKELSIYFNGKLLKMNRELFDIGNTEIYSKILFSEPIWVGKKCVGQFDALMLKSGTGRAWNRLAGIDGKRIIEKSEAFLKYFPSYSPTESKLRGIYRFYNEFLDDSMISVNNEKEGFSIHNDQLKSKLEALDKRAKEMYAKEIEKSKIKENLDMEENIRETLFQLIVDNSPISFDDGGTSGSSCSNSSEFSSKKNNKNSSRTLEPSVPRRKKNFINFTNAGIGMTYIVDRKTREVFINRDEKMYLEIIALTKQKQSIAPYYHVMLPFHAWRQKYSEDNLVSEFLECSAKQKDESKRKVKNVVDNCP